MTKSAASAIELGPVSSMSTSPLYTNVASVTAARLGQTVDESTTAAVFTTSLAQCSDWHVSAGGDGVLVGPSVGGDVGEAVVGELVGPEVVSGVTTTSIQPLPPAQVHVGALQFFFLRPAQTLS